MAAAYIPRQGLPSRFIGGKTSQCAAQCLDDSRYSYLVISDSWNQGGKRSSKSVHEVVEFVYRGTGESWESGLHGHRNRSTLLKKEQLPIIAAFAGEISFAFWMEESEMRLVQLEKRKTPVALDILGRCRRLFGSPAAGGGG